MKRKLKFSLILLMLLPLLAKGADSLSYSGRLVNSNGSPVTGPAHLKFDLAYTNNLSTILCTHDNPGVDLINGVFHVKLEFDCPSSSLRRVLEEIPSNNSIAIRVTDLSQTPVKVYSFQALHSIPSSVMAEFAKELVQMGATNGQVLTWNGTQWSPADPVGTVGGVVTIVGSEGVSAVRVDETVTVGIVDGGVTAQKLDSMGAASGQVLKWNGSAWAPAADSDTGVGVEEDPTVRAFARNDVTGIAPEVCSSNQVLHYVSVDNSLRCFDLVDDAIVDGESNKAPSQNAVFDALALKQNTIDNNSELLMKSVRVTSDGSTWMGIKAPNAAGNIYFTLPAGAGVDGQVLKTDGAGNLTWVTPTTNSGSIVDGSIVDADIAASANIAQSKISGLSTSFTNLDNRITNLTTTDIAEGSNLYFTEPRVLGTDLAGLNTTNGTINSSDTVLSSIGKLIGNIAVVSTAQSNYVLKSGDTMSGNLQMGGFAVTGLAAPTIDSDAATKKYVDDKTALSASQWSENGTSIYYNVGNVGIGTNTPNSKLTIIGDSNTANLYGNANDIQLKFDLPSWSYASINARNKVDNSARDLALQNAGGNVGIGTTTPKEKLQVRGGIVQERTILKDGVLSGWDGVNPIVKVSGLVGQYSGEVYRITLSQRGSEYAQATFLHNSLGAGTGSLQRVSLEGSVDISAKVEADDSIVEFYSNMNSTLAGDTVVRIEVIVTNDSLGSETVTINPGATALVSAVNHTEYTSGSRYFAGPLKTPGLRLNSTNNNYIELKAPAALGTNLSYTWPTNAGSTGYALTTNGSGVLSWSEVATTATSVGGDLSGTLANAQLVSSAVGTNELANGSVTYAKLNLADGEMPVAKINGLSTSLSSKEPTIAASTTSQYWRGDKSWQTLDTSVVPENGNLYFLDSRVRSALLSGYSAGTALPLAGTDTLLEALGKLEAQIIANDAAFDATGQWSKNGTKVYYNGGNVGIGPTNPPLKLSVAGLNQTSTFTVSNLSATMSITDMTTPSAIGVGGTLLFGATYHTGGSTMGTAAVGSYKEFAPDNGGNEYNHSLVFKTNRWTEGILEKMRITSAGNVGIGTSSPAAKLHVNSGNIEVSNYNVRKNRYGFHYDQGNDVAIYYHLLGRVSNNDGDMHISGSLSGHDSLTQGKAIIDVFINARNAPYINGVVFGDPVNSNIEVYEDASGNLNVYLKTGTYSQINLDIAVSGQATSYLNDSTKTTTVPTGTLVANVQDHAKLFVKNSGNVGIGTNAPTGNLHVSSSGSTFSVIERAAGQFGVLQFKTLGSNRRWELGADNSTESGADAGSNFSLWRFDDAGNQLGAAFTVNRSTGNLDVKGNVRVGNVNNTNTGTLPGYGNSLYFSGGPSSATWNSDNSDPLWIARYNVANDQTELRVNIGDGVSAEDKFVVGYTTAGAYNPTMVVQNNGNVGIGKTSPAAKLDVNGAVRSSTNAAYFTLGGSWNYDYVHTVDTNLVVPTLGTAPNEVSAYPIRGFVPWSDLAADGYTKLYAKLVCWLSNTGGTTYTSLYYQKDDTSAVKLAGTEISTASTDFLKVSSSWVDIWSAVGTVEDFPHFMIHGRVSAGTGRAHGCTVFLKATW